MPISCRRLMTDMEIALKTRNNETNSAMKLRAREIELERGQHVRHGLAPALRPHHAQVRRQHGSQPPRDRRPLRLRHQQIDPVQAPEPAERVLRDPDVHHHQVAAERLLQLLRLQDRADVEEHQPRPGDQPERAAETEVIAAGQGPRHRDRARVGEEIEPGGTPHSGAPASARPKPASLKKSRPSTISVSPARSGAGAAIWTTGAAA